MRKLTVRFQRTPEDVFAVGVLAEQNRRIYFEYDAAFIARGLALSPFRLPLQRGLVEHVDRSFGPLPGLFDDSLPDGWGLLLMDRFFRSQGISPAAVSPLDRLAYLGTRTVGALTYHPPRELEPFDRAVDLYAMGRNAEGALAGDSAAILPQLMRAGGSPGGARPKALVGLKGNQMVAGDADLPPGFAPWLIKFAAKPDVADAGPVEYAYSLMARAAGIAMPETRLFEVRKGRAVRRYFGVRRFDRSAKDANRRFHVHTLGNLIHAHFRIPAIDYTDAFKVTRTLTRNHQDALRLFRLMAFNVAAHNRDDHAKNFSFMLDDATGEWSLTPAYDLTFSFGPGGEHMTSIWGEGRRPAREHCLKIAEQEGIKKRESESIFDAVNAAIARWPQYAGQAGCSAKAIARIAPVLQTL